MSMSDAASVGGGIPGSWSEADPVTIEPCDVCKVKLPDYARKASETTTLTGHTKCMRFVDTGEVSNG